MATRFYLPSTGAAAVSPAYDAGWTNTAGAGSRIQAVTTRINSATASVVVTTSLDIAGTKRLIRQFVTDPILAQTIAGTVKAQMRCSQADVNQLIDSIAASIRVVSNDGSTFRGTLLALPPGITSAFHTSLRNHKLGTGAITLSPVTAQANDRLVFEFGSCNVELAATASGNVDISFGDLSAVDLPEDETTILARNPWVEFSQHLWPANQQVRMMMGIG